jgi:hypothetical protein
MGQPDNETIKACRQINWEDATPRLVLYAQRTLDRLTWLGVLGGPPIAGLTPTDIVHEAVQDVLSGIRVWNKKKPILDFLMNTIQSIISNKVTSLENRLTTRIEQEGNKHGITLRSKGKDISKIPDEHLSEEAYVQFIRGEFYTEREYIRQSLEHDNVVCNIAMLIIDDDIEKPSVIAEILGIDIREVYNAKKRLKTWLTKQISTGAEVREEYRNDA